MPSTRSAALWLGALAAALLGLWGVSGRARAADVIRDSTYNTPAAVTADVGADAAMKKMETAVSPAVLDGFKNAHPAPFWLFGEDRRLAVRNNIIPAHWFGNGAGQFGRFSGVARPGEFYVFQVCAIAGDKPLENFDPELLMPGLAAAPVHPLGHPVAVQPGQVKPAWIGVHVPVDAKPGEYRGTVKVESTNLEVLLNVEGDAIADSGTGDAWRLARLKWLDSQIGQSEAIVTRPFTPIRLDATARTLDILGRRITLAENGIPSQFTSYFSGSNTRILQTGRDAFAAPPALECVVDGKPLAWTSAGLRFTARTPVGVGWMTSSTADGLQLTVAGRLEYDGNLQLKMLLARTSHDIQLDDVRFVVPWAKGIVKYAMGLGLKGGKCPDEHRWKWDVTKNQDALWLGDVNIGAMLRFKGDNYRRPLINAYYNFQPLLLPDSWGGGGVELEKQDDSVRMVASSGPRRIPSAGSGDSRGLAFDIDWYFTPFKPVDIEQHFGDRYYHASQGSSTEDVASLHKQGVNIIEVHHNRLRNPYINYPFNDDSVGNLKSFVQQAHANDTRVDVYYTTRELTQNLPEFFALDSLDGEVILHRMEGVAWPVTNPNGPHPWLREHVGMDIVPAWRENLHYPTYKSKLDLAVITTPDSRWNNFYLEGLNYLVRKVGIDGLYIDDTALDRKSMQRARRILDADGNSGRRVNMHSWNHFNPLANWANSSIAFMELYPYYNGLWHGEGFNANAAPDYMLVEMSGIPFGLMSEMLDRPNPWHGMVFGMRTRWPWSGDPRPIWKLEDEFGITDSELIGWWDKDCPVKTGRDDMLATVYKKNGKSLIALASWAKTPMNVTLTTDWKALGLDPNQTILAAPAVANFQAAAEFNPGASILVEPGKGWLLLTEAR